MSKSIVLLSLLIVAGVAFYAGYLLGHLQGSQAVPVATATMSPSSMPVATYSPLPSVSPTPTNPFDNIKTNPFR